ncbi:MAG: site-specific integrase, partial [Candidatus Heimdallarchaeota archaeon]|nr:site-specific integrase [Candidatus Heimdallarchaeota archaeon]
TKAFKTKTKAGNRIIPLEKSLALEIRSYIGIKKHGYVFLSQKGHNPYRKESIINFINRYAKECSSLGFSIGMHSLRRTFCSFMSKKQIPMGKLSKMMGHKDIKTTFLYLYEIDDLEDFDDVRQAVRQMHEQ